MDLAEFKRAMLTAEARETESLVYWFLKNHPGVEPDSIVICHQMFGLEHRIWVELKKPSEET